MTDVLKYKSLNRIALPTIETGALFSHPEDLIVSISKLLQSLTFLFRSALLNNFLDTNHRQGKFLVFRLNRRQRAHINKGDKNNPRKYHRETNRLL